MKNFFTKRYLKIMLLALAVYGMSGNVTAQLFGPYIIDNTLSSWDAGHYKTFTDAVNDLNGVARTDGGPNNATIGVGGISANVVFNVKAGDVFTEAPVVIAYTNPGGYSITFQKDPSTSGANPVLKGTGGSGSSDAVLQLNSGDNFTFNGIDLAVANNTVEYGLFLNGAATNGCSNNTYENGTITLNNSNSNPTYGVYLLSAATGAAGENNGNSFYNNTVQNVLYGYNLAGASGFLDQNNQVGINGGSSNVTNLANGGIGIRLSEQNNALVFNNTVHTFTVSGGADVSGILNTGLSSNTLIYNNNVNDIHTSSGGGPGNIFGINNSNVTNVNTYNNTVNNISGDFTATGRTAVYGIYDTLATTVVNLYGNTVSNLSSAADLSQGIYNAAQGSPTTLQSNMYNNSVSNLTGAGAGNPCYMAGITSVGPGPCALYNNTVNGVTNTGTYTTLGNVFGIRFGGAVATSTIYNNSVTNINQSTPSGSAFGISCGNNIPQIYGNIIGSVTGTNTAEIDGFSGQAVSIYSNVINGPLTANAGKIYGMNVSAGNTSLFKNKVVSITGTGTTEVGGYLTQSVSSYTYTDTVNDNGISATTGIIYGIRNSGTASGIYNNYIGTFTLSGTFTEASGIKTTVGNPSVYGNTIKGLSVTSTATSGNVVTAAIYNTAIGNPPFIFSNTIGAMSMNYTGSGANVEVEDISSTTGSIYNNILTAGVTTNAGNASGIYAPYNAASGTSGIFSNTISSITSTGATGNVYGIYGPGKFSTANINNNNISGISCTNASATTIVVGGIYFSNTTGTPNKIYNNTISNISNASTASTTQVSGFVFAAGGNAQNLVYDNKIFNISNASTTTGSVVGMQVSALIQNYVFNNMICDLRADASINAANGGGVTGILYSAAVTTTGIYYNTVYLNSTAAASVAMISSAFYAVSESSGLDYRDNIFVNTYTVSSNAGSQAYGIWYQNTAFTGLSANINNNLIYAGSTSSTQNFIFGASTGASLPSVTDQTIAAYKTTTSKDAQVQTLTGTATTLSNFFVNATGPSPSYDLHLKTAGNIADAKNKGVVATAAAIGGVTPGAGDIDGDTRGTTSYTGSVVATNTCIGADEVFASCTVPAQPAAITLTTPQCAITNTANTYSVTSVANVFYSWAFTANSGITVTSGWNTNSITALTPSSITTGTTYTVSVTASNGCGNSTVRTGTITVNGVNSAGKITGTANVCQGQIGVVYTTTAIPGATQYTWTLPTGFTGASTTNSITVTIGATAVSGNITVAGKLTAPCAADGPPASYTVTVGNTPSASPVVSSPNGGFTVNQGQTGVIYQVAPIAGATSYTWTLPTGATIVSGANTDLIVVNYSNSAATGAQTIKVAGNFNSSTCSGTASAAINNVTVSALLPLTGVSQLASACAGSAVTIDLTGLSPSTTFIVHYTIGGVATQTVSVSSDPSGNGSFTFTPDATDNGLLLAITDISVTGVAYTSYSSNNTVTLSIKACTNVWKGLSPDWGTTTNWSLGFVPNSCAANVLIPAGTPNDPVISANAAAGNVEIDDAVVLTVNAAFSVCDSLNGGSRAAAIIQGTTALTLTGSSLQDLSGLFAFQNQLALDNTFSGPAQVQLTPGAVIDIYNSLALKNNDNLDVTQGTLTLKSTSSAQAAIIDNFSGSNSGTITGNITAERAYDAPVTTNSYNQHLMGSPVNTPSFTTYFGASGTAGQVIDTKCDETKSDANSPYGTVFSYNEANGTTCPISQWTVLTSGSAQNGVGYSILKIGSGKLSVTGTPNLGTSYQVSGLTNHGWSNQTLQHNSYNAGWSLLSNPYPANLDISPGSITANNGNGSNGFDAQIMVWNTTGPSAGSYTATTTIAPFQAFFVHKTSAGGNATYTIYGSDRSATSNQFYKQTADNQLVITSTNQSTGLIDKTTVGFKSDATEQFDPMYDMNKLPGALTRHTMYTLSNGKWMSQNILHSIQETSTVSMGFEPGVSGTYTMSFDGINSFDATSYIILEDLQTGSLYNVRNGAYTFTADAKDNWNRFVLHFTPAASVNTTDATCSNQGMINIIQPGTANWNYVLTDANNITIASGTLNTYSQVTASVSAGVYTLTLTDNNGYKVVKSIQVNGAQTVIAAFNPTIAELTNEEITFTSLSQNATANLWNFGDGATATGVTATHSYSMEGVYNVTLSSTNNEGCTSTATHAISVTSKSVTGIQNLENNTIKIWSYENKVNVSFSKGTDRAVISIYNILGQQLVNDKLDATGTLYTKAINNIEAGYVVVSVKSAEQTITSKVFIANNK